MSGRKNNGPRAEKKPAPPATKPRAERSKAAAAAGGGFKPNWNTLLLLALVLVVTGIVFSGVTKLHWTNWDDDEYVYENEMVMKGDYGAIWDNPVNNNWNPLPVMMHAWEWKQTADPQAEAADSWKALEDRAGLFHFNNLWMHLLCTGLVFWLMLKMGLNPIWAAFAALLFGIHPMRVESVAWITERKDVMFGSFYVGALIAYLYYLDTKNIAYYIICIALAALSLLSKIQAVSLPLSMLAIDWYRGRKLLDLKVWLEKVPFFIGSAYIGYVGFNYLQEGGTVDTDQTFSLVQRVALGFTSFVIYVGKSIVPWETCTFYPYPKEVTWHYWLGLAGAMGMIAGAALLWKKAREVTFGLAFFSVNIIFLLQIVGAGSAYLADRFTYVAYIGLVFSLAMLAQRVVTDRKSLLPVLGGAGVVLLLVCAFMTFQYIPAWTDSDTLWTDVQEKYPRKVVLSYVNRGQYLRRHGQYLANHGNPQGAKSEFDRAFEDFNTGISLQPNYHLGYLNRGNIYFDRGENDKALADYSKVLEILGPIDLNKRVDPAAAGALSNRGAIYSRKGMYQEALVDLNLAVKINKSDQNTWNNLAATYMNMKDFPKAIENFNEFLKFAPNSHAAIDARGLCYANLGKWQDALNNYNKAVSMAPNQASYLYNRAIAQFNLGNKPSALADAQKAQALGFQVDPAFLQAVQQ